VDRAGHRLGRGGGFYDRALDRARPDALVVALIHDEELLDLVPTAPHDRPVHVAVTPTGVHRLRTVPGPGGPLNG
jgi:5-formyltetrahydrofolate cyclo-ligase